MALFCINGIIFNAYSQPELIIPQHEFSICGDGVATVAVEITGTAPVALRYLFEGEPFEVSSTENSFTFDLYELGVYTIVSYKDDVTPLPIPVENESIVVTELSPNIYFTGGGVGCNNEDISPLVAHFEGEPQFVLNYMINGRPYTLYLEGFTYTFPVDQSIVIETLNLSDANCKVDIAVTARYEFINSTIPIIYGETNFCEYDFTVYSTDPTNLSTEWNISEGANYIEGINNEGSFISVTWIESGTHEVKLRLVDSASQCASQWSTLNVIVNDKPLAIELIDTTLCFELEESLIIEIPAEPEEIVTWPELGVTGSSVEIFNAGTYIFIKSNFYNCSDTGTVAVENNCFWDVHVPEAFTPNNDGINDYLEIFGLYDELELSIYSPSGILLYHANEEDAPWDGTRDGNDVPCGSYQWYVTFKGRDGMPQNKSGVVTIIR